MIPFLKQVAGIYAANERDNLIDYCFVFPNKRSGVFFQHYLSMEAAGKAFIMPEVATISDVTRRFSALTDAPRLDQLFILYNEYKELSGDIGDFDRFLFWGDMLLNDFNDVDLNLADPHKLFVNLKQFREVSANYLTPEQQEIISRYWGEKYTPTSPDEFWNHIHHDSPTPLESPCSNASRKDCSTAGWPPGACLHAMQSIISPRSMTNRCRSAVIYSLDSMC